ncbi:MAG: twin-arginine translocase subunit TatC [Halodesulfurarchaeum sp.]
MSGDRESDEDDSDEETSEINPDRIPPDVDAEEAPEDVSAPPFDEITYTPTGSDPKESDTVDEETEDPQPGEEDEDRTEGSQRAGRNEDDGGDEHEERVETNENDYSTKGEGDFELSEDEGGLRRSDNEQIESVDGDGDEYVDSEGKEGEDENVDNKTDNGKKEDLEDESDEGEELAGVEVEGDEEADHAGDAQVEMHDDYTPVERKAGPESDVEQPLADHVEEMIKRLGIVVVVAGAVSLAAFPFGEDFITFLWYSVLPRGAAQPHVYHPLELIITQLKAASLLGLVLALPVFVYETYAFMRPGLYPHERRYYLAAVPTSLILAFVGLLFGYFIVLPAVMSYFLYYSRDVVNIAFALGQTFNLMLILLGYLAIVFQIPLFIMLAIMMGLTSRTWLENRRLIFWGAFLGISFLFSPDPTGMAPILIAATMIALFEGTLLLLRWTNRG